MSAVARTRTLAAAVLLLAVLLAGQSAADRLAPPERKVATTAIVGRTGFAYLGGIRTYAAAVLWARLDPINDRYYNGLSLSRKKFLLPSIRLITWLDPTFEEAYYDGALIVYENGLKSQAVAMAAEGARNNPESAWLHANYAQILLFENDYAAAGREAVAAWRGKWPDISVEYDMLPTLEIAFNKSGRHDRAVAVHALHDALWPRVKVLRAPAGG